MDAVLSALHTAFPKMLIQFEDFSSEHAFDLLDANRRRYLCFNDDIQGTGAVILAGFMNAIRVAQADGGVDPKDHRILFFGAGSAGVGVARQLAEHFRVEYGMTEEQAKQMFWLVDSKVRYWYCCCCGRQAASLLSLPLRNHRCAGLDHSRPRR